MFFLRRTKARNRNVVVHEQSDWALFSIELGPTTARFVEDETRNDRRNANRNPEWWGDFLQLQN